MKIEDKRNVAKQFKDVDRGEAFMYKGDLYVRTGNLIDNADRMCNAVGIFEGLAVAFTERMMVEIVDAKVVIE